jgi:hypothetical protein
MAAFRLHRGDRNNYGITAEFLCPQKWLKDMVTPLAFLRLTSIDQLEKID